jgi:vancomycin aglycone glucosyltransferase
MTLAGPPQSHENEPLRLFSRQPEPTVNGSGEVRVLLSMCESHGDVEPMVVLAVQLRALGAELLARVGAPLVPVGQPVRPMVHGATPQAATDLPRRAAELVAAQFDTVAAAAEERDALVATGVMPAGGWR